MKLFIPRFSGCALTSIFLLLCGALPAQADYQSPDLEAELMPREGLSLDADAMKRLSSALLDLSGSTSGWTPKHQRLHAKIIALAHFLDERSERAGELDKRLAAGGEPKATDERTQLAATNRIWQSIRWLKSKEAGRTSNLLASYLLDIMVQFDAQHPLAENYDSDGEVRRWKMTVKPLSDFGGEPASRDGDEAVAQNDGGGANWNEDGGAADDDQAKTPDDTTVEVPRRFQVRADETVLSRGVGRLYDNKRTRTYPSVIDFKLSGKSYGDEREIKLDFAPRSVDQTKGFSRSVRRTLRQHADVSGQTHSIGVNTGFPLGGDQATLSLNELPMMIGLDALSIGKGPELPVISFGEVTSDGKIQGTRHWWAAVGILLDKMESVREECVADGRRFPVLLVPDDIADKLVNVIALNEPDFFITYECIRIKELSEVRELVFNRPRGGFLNAMGLFDDVRKVSRSKNIRTLAANKHVRARLAQCRKASPRHLSSEMLLIQGSGRRPSKLERDALVLELRSMVRRTNNMLSGRSEYMRRGGRILGLWESLRQEADPLERFVGIDDRELYQSALDIINCLRTVDRHLDRGGEDSSEAKSEIRRGQNECKRFMERARILLGEPDPDRLIKPE